MKALDRNYLSGSLVMHEGKLISHFSKCVQRTYSERCFLSSAQLMYNVFPYGWCRSIQIPGSSFSYLSLPCFQKQYSKCLLTIRVVASEETRKIRGWTFTPGASSFLNMYNIVWHSNNTINAVIHRWQIYSDLVFTVPLGVLLLDTSSVVFLLQVWMTQSQNVVSTISPTIFYLIIMGRSSTFKNS